MSKLQKKERTIAAEFTSCGGVHTKEFCHAHGIKTWMKPRHFKRMAAIEASYPLYDMDGSYFHLPNHDNEDSK